MIHSSIGGHCGVALAPRSVDVLILRRSLEAVGVPRVVLVLVGMMVVVVAVVVVVEVYARDAASYV